MPDASRMISYVSVAASAALGFVCLVAIGSVSDLVRGCIVTHRPDLPLPVGTAFLFIHPRVIRGSSYVAGFLILLAGIVSVRLAPTSDQAMRQAIRVSTFATAFASIALFATLVCLFRPFVSGIITQSVPPQ